MKALSRRVKSGSNIGICAMIAMTCSLALGQATPDTVPIPEPGSYVMLATGLVLMVLVVRFRNARASTREA